MMIASGLQWIHFMEQYYAEKVAFQYVENKEVRQVTYGEYVRDIKRFATYLLETFEQVEEVHFGLLGRNSYHYVVAFVGIIIAKGVAIPMNLEESLETIHYQVKEADVDYLFVDGEYEKLNSEGLSEYKKEQRIFGMEDYKICNHILEFEDNYDIEKLAVMLFTSGTTGTGKAVMLPHKNLLVSNGTHRESVKTSTDCGVLCILPLYHVAGIGFVLENNSSGNTVNLCTNTKYMYRDIAIMKSSNAVVVPVILQAWAKELRRGRIEKLGNIRTIVCGAAASGEETLKVFRDYGITVFQTYGLTESWGGGTLNCSNNPNKIKSVGLPVSGVEMKIEDGEVCLRSAAVMRGYYNRPEETAQVIRDGWLYTGDLGYFDEDGYLYITGRKKNLIILSSGENICPEELEELIAGNALVEEVLVGEKDTKICAKIFCKPVNVDEIRKYITEMNRGLAFFKRVTLVEFSEKPLARTATGKLIRKK